MIGILLAGGNGTRLMPYTYNFNKHFFPIYDKPMVYFSLLQFKILDIKKIIVVCKKKDHKKFHDIISYYFKFSQINFVFQEAAKGAMHAISICKKKIGKTDALINMGDHFLFDPNFQNKLIYDAINNYENIIFCKKYTRTNDFGNIEFGKNNKLIKIHEKSNKKYSNYILTGLIKISNKLFPSEKELVISKRKEYEVASFVNDFKSNFNSIKLPINYKWVDMGSFDRIQKLSSFLMKHEKIFN